MTKRRAPPGRGTGGASMTCPSCGAVSRVLRTTREDNRVLRHRHCDKCQHEFHTTEINGKIRKRRGS